MDELKPESQKSNLNQSSSFQDVYARAEQRKNQYPRTSITKFGSFGELAGGLGILFAQGIISWFLIGVLSVFLYIASSEWVNEQAKHLIFEIVKLISFTISVFLLTKVFEEEGLRALGLKTSRRSFKDFIAGFGIACFVLAMDFLLSTALGLIKIEYLWTGKSPSALAINIFLTLILFCFVGWSEELFSRGFQLRIISRALNRPLGIMLSSAYFSYLHRDNEGMTTAGLVFIFAIGVTLSLATIRTGQLWLAMGLHAGWDFFVASFWGTAISDLRVFSLFSVSTYYPSFGKLTVRLLEVVVIGVIILLYSKNRKIEDLD